MADKITLAKIELLHPKLREEAKLIYAEICEALKGKAICRFSHTLRTVEEQDALYAKGRTAPGKIVTKARGGSSMHNFGIAIDICQLVDTDGNGTNEKLSYETKIDFDGDGKADWMEIVAIFEKYQWQWGGRWSKFTDLPHFQKTFGLTLPQLQAKHKAKDFIEGTQYVKID